MNTIKTFEEFVNENSKLKKKLSQEQDDFMKLDNTFKDINFIDIPFKSLKKQYVDFEEIISLPPTFDDPLFKRKGSVNENIEKTIDIQKVRKSIMKKYELEDWQFKVKEASNEIKVAVIVPHIGSNEKMVIDDMTSMGYYFCQMWEQKIRGLIYTIIRFDPKHIKDITNLVRKMEYLKHLTPKYNLESIKENGFIPLHKNEVFIYPPRIHFFKEDTTDEDIDDIGKKLCETNSNSQNDGTYILFTIDVSRIPKNVKFTYDSCSDLAVCTEDSIPYDVVVETEEKKYKK